MSVLYPDLLNTNFPEQVQSFITMLNMTVSDADAVMGYQEAMRNGDITTAQRYFSQIANGEQKFITAEVMNTLMETCIALQRFYNSDIEPYINTKQASWETNVNRFTYLGSFDLSTQYVVNNFVAYGVNGVNTLFICISNPPVGTVPTNSTYWRQLTVRGLQGESGDGASFRYAWSSSETYYPEDIVTDENTVWVCTAENSNQKPSFGSSYWNAIYTAAQIVYPFQAEQPTSASLGYLWFKVLS